VTRAVPASAFLVLLLTASTSASSEVAPYRLAIEVAFPEGAPSPTLEQEVLRRVLDTLVRRACFESVQSVGEDGKRPDADLLLHLEFRGIEDETRYDDSLAGFVNPDDPDAKLRFTLVLSVDVAQRLAALPGEVEVSHQRLRPQVSRRPMFQGEDVRREAKDEMLSTIAKRAASFACGASRKKMQRAVDQARAGS
jgi:hypothetical protein